MARLAYDSLVLPDWDISIRGIGNQPAEQELDALFEVSDNLPEGEVVGAVLRFPIADGYAFYRVIEEDGPTLTIQHIHFLDAWTIDPMMIKGMDRDDVLQHLAARKRLNALFGR